MNDTLSVEEQIDFWCHRIWELREAAISPNAEAADKLRDAAKHLHELMEDYLK